MTVHGKAYSTSNPVTVSAFTAACDAERTFTQMVIAAAAAIGNNKGALRSSGVFGMAPETLGLAVDDPNDPPDGWIYSKTRDQLVPRRGQAGADARAWLAAHQPSVCARVVLAEHGLPFNDLFERDQNLTRHFNVPAIFAHDGTIWAYYRGTPGRWAGGPQEPDAATWTERKLSEYYAAREARDAAEARVPA